MAGIIRNVIRGSKHAKKILFATSNLMSCSVAHVARWKSSHLACPLHLQQNKQCMPSINPFLVINTMIFVGANYH